MNIGVEVVEEEEAAARSPNERIMSPLGATIFQQYNKALGKKALTTYNAKEEEVNWFSQKL